LEFRPSLGGLLTTPKRAAVYLPLATSAAVNSTRKLAKFSANLHDSTTVEIV